MQTKKYKVLYALYMKSYLKQYKNYSFTIFTCRNKQLVLLGYSKSCLNNG